jgi:hypothetical protein
VPGATSARTLNVGLNHYYEVLGRVVESDLPLPQLVATAAEAPGLVVRKLSGPASPGGEQLSEQQDASGSVTSRVYLRDDAYVWRYEGVADFVLSRTGRRVRWWAAEGRIEDTAALLAGPIVGFAFQLQGLTSLHATAVVCNGKAIALAAPSGYGKSTLASALMRRGCALLTDDILALEVYDGRPWALASAPRLKLWPDSLERFVPAATGCDLQTYVSWADKRLVPAEGLGLIHEEPAPLGAFVLLSPTPPESPPSLTRLHGNEALLALLASTYRGPLLRREPAVLARQLEAVHAVASAVPVHVLSSPRSLERVDETARALLALIDGPDSE